MNYDHEPEMKVGHEMLKLIITKLPWAIVGILIIIGGLTAAFAGLPFATKTDLSGTNASLDRAAAQIETLSSSINTMTTSIAVMQKVVENQDAQLTAEAATLNELRSAVEQHAIHIEGLEADEKARESQELEYYHRHSATQAAPGSLMGGTR